MSTIWVCGASRSGTTLIARALGRHESIESTPELHLFNLLIPYLKAKNAFNEASFMACLESIRGDGFLSFKEKMGDIPLIAGNEHFSIDDALKRFFNSDNYVCEQTGINLYHIDDIKNYCSQSLFIVMKRDVRAVISSQISRHRLTETDRFGLSWRDYWRIRLSGNVLLQLWLFRATATRIRSLSADPACMLIDFDALTSEPIGTLSAICVRLGIEFDEAMLNIGLEGSSHQQKTENAGFVVRKRRYSSEAGMSTTAVWLCQQMYPDFISQSEPAGIHPTETLVLLLDFLWKTPLALLLSLSSYANPLEAFRKRFL